MQQTILTWNVTNWITVVIMAAIGFTLLALAAQLFHGMRGTGNGEQVSNLTAPPSGS